MTQSGHEISGLSLSNITYGDNAKSKKGRVVILVLDTSSGPVLDFCQVPSKYSKGIQVFQIKGDNSKSKKGKVVILVRDTSSGPVLHFYQVPKYSKGYSSYRVDKKFYANAESNWINPKNNVPAPTPCGGGVVGGGYIRKPELSFLSASTFLPSKIKVIQNVLELQNRHKIKSKHKKGRRYLCYRENTKSILNKKREITPLKKYKS